VPSSPPFKRRIQKIGPNIRTLTSRHDLLSLFFVFISLSLSTEREISFKIKAGGGTIIEDYTTLMDPMQEVNLTNVILISFTTLRTAKYISALALNIPRLSYRWIDACSEAVSHFPKDKLFYFFYFYVDNCSLTRAYFLPLQYNTIAPIAASSFLPFADRLFQRAADDRVQYSSTFHGNL